VGEDVRGARSDRGRIPVELLTVGAIAQPTVHDRYRPQRGAEPVFAEILGEVAGLERVPVDSHFFDDPGADSLMMARFWARVRKREELSSVWTEDTYRNWSLTYFRFWLVQSLVRSSPLVLFVGTPLYPLFLRALGANIGRRAVIASRYVPMCTDLLTVGDVVIRAGAFFTTYRAHAGLIHLPRINTRPLACRGEDWISRTELVVAGEVRRP
jgi:hypothetical protein